MAFLKYAKANIVRPNFHGSAWDNIRVASGKPKFDRNLIQQASEILGDKFSPKNHLLTHATIIASVNVEDIPNVKLGSVVEDGKSINRKFSDYQVSSDTDKYINNNLDCWSRPTLLKSYRTFIGAHNFCEHVQIEDLSKGRIIDAVPRDVGDSVYVDILVATNRKHAALIKDIESGRMNSMSMGCFLPGTQVSMSDGTRVSIEDVQPGDMVLTHKGRMREVLNKQVRHGVWETRTIKAVGLPSAITSTDNHPFFVYRQAIVCGCGCGEPLEASKHRDSNRRMTVRFKKGHDKRILNPNGTYSLEEYQRRTTLLDDIKSFKLKEVRADELQIGDFVCFPRVQEDNGTTTINTPKARLLGYFLAEGSFLKYKGDPVEVQFNFSIEEKNTYVAEVVNLLKQAFPNAKNPWVQERPDRSLCVVHIYGRDVAAWFKEHGGEYSHGKKLSPEVMDWPVEKQKHLIGTWINGDGCLHNIHGNTSATTVSYSLACQMHTLFARCGFFARMYCGVQGRSVEVRQVVNGGLSVRDKATGKFPAFTLTVGKIEAAGLSEFTDKVSFSTEHKNKKLRVQDDMVMFPITSVESGTHKGWVHDMEVEEDHSYVVDGVAVHNCSVDFTLCTKCGHVAVDETQMCSHVKYEKGNVFYDNKGHQHRVAELCGHHSVDPTGGVNFIEASWVAVPAFTGAVARNIVELKDLNNSYPATISKGIISVPSFEIPLNRLKSASKFADLFEEGDGETTKEEPKPDTPEKSPLDGLQDELKQTILDKILDDIKGQISNRDLAGLSSISLNETIIKEATVKEYRKKVRSLVASSASPSDFIFRLAHLNNEKGVEIKPTLYQAAFEVGSLDRYKGLEDFKFACVQALGCKPKKGDLRTLAYIAKLVSLI